MGITTGTGTHRVTAPDGIIGPGITLTPLRTDILDWAMRWDRPNYLHTEQVVELGLVLQTVQDKNLHRHMRDWRDAHRPPPAFIADPDRATMWTQLDYQLERKQTP